MRKLLFLIPVAAAGLLLTGCDEASYRERTVVYDRGPAYYGGGDTDFYYVSTRPYSRSYGELYLRDGRYYYSRGGSYHVYDRPTYRYDRSRVDYRHDRDRDYRGRDRYRSSDRTSELRQDIQERNLEHVRNQQKIQEYRERQVYNANQQKLDYRQARQESRNEQLKNQWEYQKKQAQYNQQARAQQAVYRQPQGQKKRKKDHREE